MQEQDSAISWLEEVIANAPVEHKQWSCDLRQSIQERRLQAEEQKRQRTENWGNLIRTHETELRENRFSPQNLYNLAKAYFGLFSGQKRDTQPRDRISNLIGGDPKLVDAVMIGLRDAALRDDIPEVDEIIALYTTQQEPFLAYPVLASLHLSSRKEFSRLDGINTDLPRLDGVNTDLPRLDVINTDLPRVDRMNTAQKRKVLAIHYCFAFHMVEQQSWHTITVKPSADWHQRIFQQEPDLVLDVLYKCAYSSMHAGMTISQILFDIDDMEVFDIDDMEVVTSKEVVGGKAVDVKAAEQNESVYAAKIYDVRLRLLNAYPAHARNDQMESFDHLIAKVLQNPNKNELNILTRQKLALKSMGISQRVRWLAVDFLTSPNQALHESPSQALPALKIYVQKNEIRIRHFATFLDNIRKHGYSTLSALEDFDDPDIFRDMIETLGRSFSPLFMNGLVTLPMEMSDYIASMIRRLSSMPSAEAHKALVDLVEDPYLDQWRDRLITGQEYHRVIYRDAAYQHPSTEQVQATLDNRAPANAADLAALLADRLLDIAEDLRGDNSNLWRQFWNEDSYGRVNNCAHGSKPENGPRPENGPKLEHGPKPENSCRDALLSTLKLRLPAGVDSTPEGRYASEKRADIRVSCRDFNVPIEIKKNSHSDLWHTIRGQLIPQYTTDPATSGYGIFVVLWFGECCTTTTHEQPLPSTPEELRKLLQDNLSADEKHKISIIVLDATRPVSPLRDQGYQENVTNSQLPQFSTFCET